MSDALVCCETWFQDVSPVCCVARASSASLLSSMEDHWSQPFSSTEVLDCSEDTDTYEDYELRGDASSAADKSVRQFQLAMVYYPHLSELIRSDLQNQNDLYRDLHSSLCTPGRGLNALLSPATQADRQLLVGWMLQLSAAAGLQRETLFGAASLLDRFLDATHRNLQGTIPTEKLLQLLAIACISVAMKMEEGLHLHPITLLRVSGDALTGEQMYQLPDLGRMEWVLLQTVGWRAHVPTPHTFMQHLLAALVAPENTNTATRNTRTFATHTDSDTSACAVPVTAAVSTSLDGSPSGVSSSCSINDCCWGEEAEVACVWDEELRSKAATILDMALVYVTPLAHRPSTLAMACLLMASTWSEGLNTATAAAAAANPIASSEAAAAASGATAQGYPGSGRPFRKARDNRTNGSPSNNMDTTPPASPFLSSDAASPAPAPSPAAERFRLLLRTMVAVTGLPVHQLAPGLTSCVGELEGILQRQRQAAAEMAAAAADVGM